jgi:hypothetical protein
VKAVGPFSLVAAFLSGICPEKSQVAMVACATASSEGYMTDDKRTTGYFCRWPRWCVWPLTADNCSGEVCRWPRWCSWQPPLPSVDELIADAISREAAGDADAARWLMAHAASLLDAGIVPPDVLRLWLADRLAAGAAAPDDRSFAAAFGVATPRRGPGHPGQSDPERLEAAMPLAAAVTLLVRKHKVSRTRAIEHIAETCGPDKATSHRLLKGVDYKPMERIADDDLRALASQRFGRALAQLPKKVTRKN